MCPGDPGLVYNYIEGWTRPMVRVIISPMRTYTAFAIVCLLPALPVEARTLRTGPVTVAKDGQVTLNRTVVGKVTLPKGRLKASHATHMIGGRKVLHLVVSAGASGRSELVATWPPSPKLIFSGRTGPQGVDHEWMRELKVGSDGILLYQGREGAARCDGAPVYLFPRMYDFAAGKFRPVAHLPRVEGLPTLTASRGPPGVPAGPPLNTFRLVFASTHLGDEQRAANLVAPVEAEDGRPETAWAEGLGGAGQGEHLTARSRISPYRLRALQIIPGHAVDEKAFRRANRLKSALLLLSPSARYRISFPRDPARDKGQARDPYWVLLPKPVATTCATLVIEAVYPGTLARSPRSGGRTAISELRFYTELEFSGGVEQVLRDIGATDKTRGENAVSILVRLGRQGLELVKKQIAGKAPPHLLRRAARVLSAIKLPETAPILASLLPRLGAGDRRIAFDALGRLGQPAVQHLLPHLDKGPLELRCETARLLGRLGGERARSALLAQAGSGSEQLRKAVVDGLASLRGKDDLDEMLKAANQSKAERLADLILTAGRLGRSGLTQPRTAASISAHWSRARSFEIRYRIITAIGRLDPEGQLPLLVKAAADSDPVLRWIAVEQIRRVRSPAATQALVGALANRDPRARAAAALGLSQRPKDAAIGRQLARRLKVERWDIVASALAESLGRHCTQRGVDVLLSTIRGGRRGVDHRALLSLASCKPKGLDRNLLAIVKSSTWRTSLRLRALRLLQPTSMRARFDNLLQIFRDLQAGAATNEGDERVAAALAIALGGTGDQRAADPLADSLGLSPYESIRAAAAAGLGKLCAKSTVKTLRRASKDASRMVQRAASAALKRCRF